MSVQPPGTTSALAPTRAQHIFDSDRLMRAAEAEAGAQDWGEPPFRDALDRLLADARAAQLDPARAEAFCGNIQRLMVNRLRLYADRSAYPEIAAQQIVAPLIVTGLPRSGTTILHALLAQDPAARSPLRWEVEQPSPPPRAESFADDPRIASAQAAVERLPAQFRAMHAMGAELPEECNSIMMMAFRSPNFDASVRLPAYMEWLLHEADMAPAFQLHRHVLQHLQAFAPASYWVLKAPPHLTQLDALLAAYPDARIVFTHRDPADVLPSNASLIAFLRGADAEARLQAGADQVYQWGLALDRLLGFRRAHAGSGRFVDTYYADFMDDPLAVVRTVYDHFGMTLTPDAEDRMRVFMAGNEQGKHGRHEYDAADFGLQRQSLHTRFADYIAACDVPLN